MVIDVLKSKKMLCIHLRNNLIRYLCSVILRADFKTIKIGLANEELNFRPFYLNQNNVKGKRLSNYSHESGSSARG